MVRCSSGADGDARGAGAGFGFDDDFDIVAESGEKAQQALDGESFELVVEKGGDFGLIDVECGGHLRLSETTTLDNAADGGSEADLGVEFFSVGQTEIGEDVAAAGDDGLLNFFSHIAPCSADGPS